VSVSKWAVGNRGNDRYRDMEEQMTHGRILEDQLGWFAIPDAIPQEKRVFGDKWRVYADSVRSVGIPAPSMRLNRTMRVFIAWK